MIEHLLQQPNWYWFKCIGMGVQTALFQRGWKSWSTRLYLQLHKQAKAGETIGLDRRTVCPQRWSGAIIVRTRPIIYRFIICIHAVDWARSCSCAWNAVSRSLTDMYVSYRTRSLHGHYVTRIGYIAAHRSFDHWCIVPTCPFMTATRLHASHDWPITHLTLTHTL